MAFGPRLEMRQSQQLVMTPQLQQAIKLLQMSNLELSEFVLQEIEQNPLLETVDPDSTRSREEAREAASVDAPTPEAEAAMASASEPAGIDSELREDRLTRAEETFDTGLENLYADNSRSESDGPAPGDAGGDWSTVGKGGDSRFEEMGASIEETLAEAANLREHLLAQLGLAKATPIAKLICADLIEAVDEAGYLRADLAEAAHRLGAGAEEVEAALKILQSFDPTGVGARDLAECLGLQLAEKNRLDPAMVKLLANLEMLARGEQAKLLKICGVDAEDLTDMLGEIRRLEPRPGRPFGGEPMQPVVPDVFVRPDQHGGWSVELNGETLPKLIVNQRYLAKISTRRGPSGEEAGEVKAYLAEKLQTANWLVKSLDQRARTILKVSAEIVRQQDGFFAYGVRELRPLNLKTVAAAVEMHESTISRVTSSKYMATNRGVFELKYFFTAAIAAADGGAAFSAEAVRHRIKSMIDAEPQGSPLSDDDLVKALREHGIDIARRTVAKYRESMNIPSSVRRRRVWGVLA